MARLVTFTFTHGVEYEGLERRLGFLVFKHRAHGASDSELAQFLSRDIEDAVWRSSS